MGAGSSTKRALDAISKKDVAALTAALDAGAPVTGTVLLTETCCICCSFTSDTSLLCHAASSEKAVELMQLLISRGADVNERVSDLGFTALHAAVCNCPNAVSAEAVSLLLKSGADVHAVTVPARKEPRWVEHLYIGSTPLLVAAQKSKKEVVPALIAAGASVHATAMAVDWAASPNSSVPVPFDTRWTALHWAVTKGNPDLARLLVDAGADCSAAFFNCPTDSQFTSLLHNGSIFSTIALARAMNDSSTVNIFKQSVYNTTVNLNIQPVHLVGMLGDVVDVKTKCDILDALLKGGADINAKMTGGITILHLMVGLLLGLNREIDASAARKEVEFLDFLVAKEVDVLATTDRGRTALQMCGAVPKFQNHPFYIALGARVKTRTEIALNMAKAVAVAAAKQAVKQVAGDILGQ